jgi:hypothetical protein
MVWEYNLIFQLQILVVLYFVHSGRKKYSYQPFHRKFKVHKKKYFRNFLF